MTEGAQDREQPAAQPARPELSSTISEADKAFAAKAKDLEALRTAVVDAAGVGAGLWFSYIFVLLYLFIAAGSVTHKDLFYKSPIKLPFLNIELPLLGFFFLGPLLFLIVHGYVLLHFVLLAGKTGAFHTQLEMRLRPHPDIRTDLRRQLPSNIFVQILAGPREVREGVVGALLKRVAWISLVIGPVALLIFFLLQFLPFHDEWLTWWHRIAILADLALLWLLWPSVALGKRVRMRHLRTLLRRKRLPQAMAVFCLALLILLFPVATFPGEILHRLPALRFVPTGPYEVLFDLENLSWKSPHELLIDGEIDWAARAPKSLWSNRIVLPDLDVVDRAKFDTEEKMAALPETVSLRKRHLEGAILIGAKLRKADLTGSFLQDAQLDGADLRESKFECGRDLEDCAQLNGASFFKSQLIGASLEGANLVEANLISAQLQMTSLKNSQLKFASLGNANLQGASLAGANLQGANLQKAKLQGAVFNETQLQYAVFDEALMQNLSFTGLHIQGASFKASQLQGASFHGAELQGASFVQARLQGAIFARAKLHGTNLDEAHLYGASLSQSQLLGATLFGANLKGASFDRTNLQGASFDGANLQGVSFDRTNLQGATFDGANLQGASFDGVMIWRSDFRNALLNPTFMKGNSEVIVQNSFDDLIMMIQREIPDGGRRQYALRRIKDLLNPSAPLDDETSMHKNLLDLEASPPNPEIFLSFIASTWRDIGCKASTSPFIQRELIRRVHLAKPFSGKIQGFASGNADDFLVKRHLTDLADHFLKDKCAGAKGLTEAERAFLKAKPWNQPTVPNP